jgi:hypothetical protein
MVDFLIKDLSKNRFYPLFGVKMQEKNYFTANAINTDQHGIETNMR